MASEPKPLPTSLRTRCVDSVTYILGTRQRSTLQCLSLFGEKDLGVCSRGFTEKKYCYTITLLGFR